MSEIENLKERLKSAARSTSNATRFVAEQKSLRQADNPEGRTDLYEWTEPEETLEWEALTTITTLQSKLAEAERALTFIADLPDPGEQEERSATFYRIHAANLKQVAARALGRQTVSDEALQWAEDWWNSDEAGEARASIDEAKRRGEK